jgi:RNA polymerase sigma-70 factor (ECF subfamily)
VNDAASVLYDRLLILRCQAGDEAALAELIARYSPALRFFLRNLAEEPAAADDLLQETWFDVYRKVNRLRDPGAFAAWLYRIARDKAFRARRRGRSPIAIADEALDESLLADDGHDDPFTPEDAAQVRAALDGLPSEHREVLVLRFVEDMTYEQIAEVIERPVGTVRSRIHYAKVALRTKLHRLTPERKDHPPCPTTTSATPSSAARTRSTSAP